MLRGVIVLVYTTPTGFGRRETGEGVARPGPGA
jgi:hypothetical protein